MIYQETAIQGAVDVNVQQKPATLQGSLSTQLNHS